MKKKILNLLLMILMLGMVLVILTGCDDEEDEITIENEEVEVEAEKISTLSEEEALEIGYELFYQGKYPPIEGGKDGETSLVEETNYIEDGTISYEDYSIAYKFLDSSSVEDLYTAECLEDFENHVIAEFTIKQIDGDWYFIDYAHGGAESLFGEILTIENISDDTIEFTLTEYFSSNWFDALLDGDEDYISSEDYDDETEFMEAVKEKYTDYTTMNSDFVIKLEDGIWKIDVQSVTP